MRIGVIGGGASGMMAAGIAAKNGADATLFEKNEKLGKKLFITGKGRCNITNNCEKDEFFKNIVNNSKFLMSAFSKFSNHDTYNFFSEFLNLKVERGNRVFPESDKSSDVIKALDEFLKSNNVKVLLNSNVLKITLNGDKFLVSTKNCDYIFDKVVIATGGISYSKTGSSGDGYKFAKILGHNIIDLKPALVPIECDMTDIKGLAGLSLKNVTASVEKDGKALASEFGEMLFTHEGVSGPIILTLSSKINRADLSNCYLCIDFKPALTHKELDARILRDFEKFSNKQFKNALDELLPKSLVPKMIEYVKIPEERQINSITSLEREKLVNSLKEFKIEILKLGKLDEAIVTAGGVDVLEINPKTLESKIVKNLYFCGEIIDCDALTGGFNMQIAFSTGYCAGFSSANI